jgi:hypothetical protein
MDLSRLSEFAELRRSTRLSGFPGRGGLSDVGGDCEVCVSVRRAEGGV